MNGIRRLGMLTAIMAGCCLATTAFAAKVTIAFWHHYNAQSPENTTLDKILIPRFQQQNPDITVNAVPLDWEKLHEKILVSASSGQLPDVVRSDIAWIPEFQRMGILVALDREMPDFSLVASKLLEGPMATARIKGNSYGLAMSTNTKILFYNQGLFASAGLTPPRTFAEFFAAARKLSGTSGGRQIWGYGEPELRGWNICPFIWSNGGDITDPGCTKATGYLNGPDAVEIIQKLADLYRDGAMAGFNSGDLGLTDGYGTGRYAMIIEGPWKFAELATTYPNFKPATSQMPRGAGGSAQVLGGEDIVMMKTARKDAAWKFMKFMTDMAAQVDLAKVGQIPVNKAAVDSPDVKAISTLAPFLQAIKTAKPRPPIAAWTEIDNVIRAEVTLAVTGRKPVQKAMDDAAQQIDALLAKT